MFEEYNNPTSPHGEDAQKRRILGIKGIMFLGVCVISLIAAGISKWSKSSLHDNLAKRHEQTTAYFDPTYMQNGQGANIVYSIGYTFTVNGKTYHNYGESKINPKYPRGIVFYNPDDPEENELQPIPKEEEYRGNDRVRQE